MKEKHPITFVIFGATGDLAQKKLIPALMDLYTKDLLPEDFNIVGYSRKDLSHEDYREFVSNSLNNKGHSHPEKLVSDFLKKITYKQGDFNLLENYESLSKYLSDLDKEIEDCSNKIFHLAVPPSLYENIFKMLSDSGLSSPCTKHDDKRWTRVLVEKPFGSDSENAKRLDKMLGKLFKEDQIFRIDHYLAKEAIQNILFFRFANAIFEPIWNREHIDRVELKLNEKDIVPNRVNFYDGIGALRDVGQNHLLQMLALVSMEDPGSVTADSIRESRGDVLSKVFLSSKDSHNLVRGRYDSYLETEGVSKDSKTETYFRVKLEIKNSRWKGVPFYLESGKALDEDSSEIKIVFKDKESSVCLIDETCRYNNTLTININDQEISICFWAKKPGLTFDLEQKKLSFKYGQEENKTIDAYEKVIYDCIKGDQSLFTSTYESATNWRIISDIMKAWKNLPLVKYKNGIDPKEIKNN